MTSNFGALNQRAFTSGHGKVLFAMTEQQRENLAQLRDIAETVPATGSLAATERDTPHLAQREHLFTLKYQDQGDADYLLYAYDDLDYGAARALIQQSLRAGTHGLHAERPGYVVLRRGAPTDRNVDLLSRLQR